LFPGLDWEENVKAFPLSSINSNCSSSGEIKNQIISHYKEAITPESWVLHIQIAAIISLMNVHTRFGLARIEDEQFFPEWSEGLPKITEAEKNSLDLLRRRYLYGLEIGFGVRGKECF
jgi:hypothetical protein